jgi:hypothetical protein
VPRSCPMQSLTWTYSLDGSGTGLGCPTRLVSAVVSVDARLCRMTSRPLSRGRLMNCSLGAQVVELCLDRCSSTAELIGYNRG